MAPTPSPILVQPSNPSSGTHFHRLRRQALTFSRHPQGPPSASHNEQSKPRDLVGTLRPSVIFETPPPPPPTPPGSSGSVVLPPEPSTIPTGNNQPQGSNQSGDVPGDVVAGVIVIVLILGGLVGLLIGGEMLRRQAKTRGHRVPSPRWRCVGRRRPNQVKSTTEAPQQRTKGSREAFPRDEKPSTRLTRPPPVLDRERHRNFSDVWPVRSLSRLLSNRRSRPEQVEPSPRRSSLVACPQTTWSEFTPVTLYVPPPRIILDCIPEEHEEDCQSETDSDTSVVRGVTLNRSSKSDFMVSASQTKRLESSREVFLGDVNGSESSMAKGGGGPSDCQIAKDEDSRSLGSSAPDMTSDGGESSRSSTASLESLGGVNDRESLGEEVFELKRAQTRSMQMNRGVLLSLSLKTLGDNQKLEPRDGEFGFGPCSSPSTPGTEGSKEDEVNLATFSGSFNAVSLDGFPSLPSVLPVIPSFASGF